MSAPIYCRRCGRAVRYVPARYSYAHKAPGADHAPVPYTPTAAPTPAPEAAR